MYVFISSGGIQQYCLSRPGGVFIAVVVVVAVVVLDVYRRRFEMASIFVHSCLFSYKSGRGLETIDRQDEQENINDNRKEIRFYVSMFCCCHAFIVQSPWKSGTTRGRLESSHISPVLVLHFFCFDRAYGGAIFMRFCYSRYCRYSRSRAFRGENKPQSDSTAVCL